MAQSCAMRDGECRRKPLQTPESPGQSLWPDDVRLAEAPIAPATVTPLPCEPLESFRDPGRAAVRFATRLDAATAATQRLAALGIDLDEAAAACGVRGFANAHESLLLTLAHCTAGTADPPPAPAACKGHRT
jgi:hypothetical protein